MLPIRTDRDRARHFFIRLRLCGTHAIQFFPHIKVNMKLGKINELQPLKLKSLALDHVSGPTSPYTSWDLWGPMSTEAILG
jgi:hypothetical protein